MSWARTGALDTLKIDAESAAGFINQTPAPKNRRNSFLEMTDAGLAKMDAVIVAWEAVDAVILEALGSEDAKELFQISRRQRSQLGGKKPERGPDR